MLAAERHVRIIQLLNERASVRTIELAEALQVTDETIRRDLEQLHNEGALRRTHGGAVRLPETREELPHDTRQIQFHEEKIAIARAALQLIEPNDVIYLDASSTSLELACLLGEAPLTVISNSHLVISQLRKYPELSLIVIGGDYDHNSHSFIGPAAQRAVQRYRIDKMFCSGNGIDADQGVSEVNEWQASIKELLIGHSRQVCYLADASKIGNVSTYFFASCEDIDILVTNPGVDEVQLERIHNHGVRIIASDVVTDARAS